MVGHSAITADLSLMRELNRALVLQLIRREGRISRADIAKHTQLSRSTVSSIISDLIEERIVSETGIGTSKGGRRPIILEFNYQARYIIGLDVSRNSITAVITDLNAQVEARQQIPFDVHAGSERGLAIIKQLISTMLKESPVGRGTISAIGIGVPGPLDYRSGRTIAPPVMPGWDNVPIKEELHQTFGLPVSIDNDANLAAMAEYRWGAGQGVNNLVYIYMSSAGIGSGLIIDNHIYRGSIGSAGEIGHTILSVDAVKGDATTNAGTLESLASQPILLQGARDLGLIGANDGVEALLRTMKTSVQAHELLQQKAHYLGVAVAGIINILNPDRVVVGGTIPEASPLVIDTICATVRQRALAIAARHTTIVAGSLGRNVVALGAAALATERLFASPALEHPATLGVHLDSHQSLFHN